MHLPEQFRERMRQMLGEEEYQLFLSCYDRPRAQALRVNTLKISVSRFLDLFPEKLTPVPWCAAGFYWTEGRPGKHPWHEAGLYYMQEASAMSVAALSGARPGEKILDLCAAPGGKSTQLSCMLEGKGLLVSNEIDADRAKVLGQNIERMGVRNAVVLNETPEKLAGRFPMFFDRVIVDAPCSGEGMFRKEEQAVTMWSQENVEHCAARQQDILDEAARMVRSGGFLEYSTCTFAPEEDEGSVARFLARHPEFTLVDLPAMLGEKMQAWGFEPGRPAWGLKAVEEDSAVNQEETAEENAPKRAAEICRLLTRSVRLFPHRLQGEGHFVALLQREGEGALSEAEVETPVSSPGQKWDEGYPGSAIYKEQYYGRSTGTAKEKSSGSKSRSKDRNRGSTGAFPMPAQMQEFCKENLTVDLLREREEESGSVLCENRGRLCLKPMNLPLQGLRVIQPGLLLGEIRSSKSDGRIRNGSDGSERRSRNERFEPSHTLAMALHPEDVQRVLDLPGNSREAAAFIRGETLACDPAWKGWVLVTIDGCSIGWGKASGGVLKNHYPKGLRKDLG